MVTEVESSLAYAVLPVLRIEVALARMAIMESTVQLKDLLSRFGGGQPAQEELPAKRQEPARQKAPAPERAKAAARETPPDGGTPDDTEEQPGTRAAMASPLSPDIESLSAHWAEIVGTIGNAYPSVGPSLALAVPVSFENGLLVLRFTNGEKFHLKTVESNAAKIAEVMSTLTGATVTIKCIQDSERQAARKATEHENLIAREPIIGTIIDLFGGKIK